MHVWIVVVALLALSVLFLFISLFLKDNQYEDELDELSEGLLELNREVYLLKKKIQELEGTPIYRAPVEAGGSTPGMSEVETLFEKESETPFVTESDRPIAMGPSGPYTPPEVTGPIRGYDRPGFPDSVESTAETIEGSEELHEITRKHILTLFSHGGSYEQIAEQLNVSVATVQATIDSYFDSSKG